MTDHKAARDRCAAFLKGQIEPVCPNEICPSDECPICLDAYEVEQPVRIKIGGCGHVFGRNCLTAILTNNPRLEKTCPLCRTKWMDALAGAPSESGGNNSRVLARMPYGTFSARPTPRLHGAHGTTHRTIGDRMTMPSAGPPSEVINLDSDDEEDPYESFRSITRDINSVRERARITQGSRKQRKEVKKPTVAGNLLFSGAGPIRRETRGNHGDGQPSQPGPQTQQEQPTPFAFYRMGYPPHRNLSALENIIQSNWLMPTAPNNASQSANQHADPNEDVVMGSVETGVDQNSEPTLNSHPTAPGPLDDFWEVSSRARGTPGFLPSARTPGTNTPPARTPGFTLPVRTSSLRPNQRPGFPPNPFDMSPTPETDAEAASVGAFPSQTERLDHREKELVEREDRINDRERTLKERERMLEDRDRALFQREQRIAQREGTDTRLTQVRTRQFQEMEAMLARHREEMRTSL
ncbi:hypothetical protein BU23DRAFT_604364 [Bimuria novae-zelandiae CBS 107.79]|uniref:RING-type domain-containing protein n=1 Tax=Bimuria novae-zelandiae CBS 107.79 TaxID=1447943 RepID=A0A6A5UJW6_9PLEO|nr:hypothetical protein BU23DRAFT_604364 [Bimuria novae-zelandiae CBS 107.79]